MQHLKASSPAEGSSLLVSMLCERHLLQPMRVDSCAWVVVRECVRLRVVHVRVCLDLWNTQVGCVPLLCFRLDQTAFDALDAAAYLQLLSCSKFLPERVVLRAHAHVGLELMRE